MLVTHLNVRGRRPSLLAVAGTMLGHAARRARRLGAATTPFRLESPIQPFAETEKSGRSLLRGRGTARRAGEPPTICAEPVHGLTRREQEVLHLLVEGRTDPQIAARLCISPRTASWHVGRILAKLGAPSRTAAATLALRHGLVPSTHPVTLRVPAAG
jgi:DNA-binding CsgD family transcriptional regulator